MKINKLLVSAIAFSLIAFNAYAKEIKFGKDITLKDKTSVSKILENPKSFVGKTLLIEGTVLDVCPKRGCWMKVSSDKKKESIKLKVEDGDMIFPTDALGKMVKAEGTVVFQNIDGKKVYAFKPISVSITEK
ncbi:MAG: DUF4920 domain-containing protein [Candidatus Sericytochromatia bacterium]